MRLTTNSGAGHSYFRLTILLTKLLSGCKVTFDADPFLLLAEMIARDPVARCSDAWEFITAVHDWFCPAGTSANCQVACNSDGDVVQSSCMCFQ